MLVPIHKSGRVNEARARGGGINYTIDVFIPGTSGNTPTMKCKSDVSKSLAVHFFYLRFKTELEKMGAVVRSYNV